MSTLKVNDIQTTSGSPNLGRVINVIQTSDSARTAISGGAGFFSYSGLDTTVTPLRSNSKFLILYNLRLGAYQYSRRATLYVNGQLSNSGDTGANASSTGSIYDQASGALSSASYYEHTGEYLYSHSGSSSFNITFQVYKQDTNAIYLNRSFSYDDSARGRSVSTLTIMEISQ